MPKIPFFGTQLKVIDLFVFVIVHWAAGGSFSWEAPNNAMERTAMIAGGLAVAVSVLVRALDSLSDRVYDLEHPGDPDDENEIDELLREE
jgi:hypothetical protein